MQQIKNLMHQMQSMPNSSAALQNLVAQNPMLQNVLKLSRTKNVSLQQIAQMMAQQKGVDINQLIKELTS